MVTRTLTILDEHMKLRTVCISSSDMNDILYESIIRIMEWLADRVISNTNLPQGEGFFLKKHIKKGITIDVKTHNYLIRSYEFWRNKMTDTSDCNYDNFTFDNNDIDIAHLYAVKELPNEYLIYVYHIDHWDLLPLNFVISRMRKE